MMKTLVVLLLATLAIVGVTWYMMEKAEEQEQAAAAEKERVEKGFLITRQELNDKLEEYKRRKSDVEDQIARFENLKTETTQEFLKTGVKNANDVEGNPDAKRKLESIHQFNQDIKKLTIDITLFDDAISAIERGLVELDRKQLMENVAVNDKTYKQLRTVVEDHEDRLSKPKTAMEKLEMQDLLNDILDESSQRP